MGAMEGNVNDELAIRMARAEIDTVLQKYNMQLVAVEVRANGQPITAQVMVAKAGPVGCQIKLVAG